MPEFHTPTPVVVDPTWSTSTLLARRAAHDPHGTLIERSTGLGGTWSPVSAATFAAEVVAVAKGLVARGVEPGDTVAIMSRTRYEWSLVDFAVWAAGGVVVPVYETSSAEQVAWILSDSAVRLAVVETAAHASVAHQGASQAAKIVDVLVIDEGGIAELVRDGAAVADEEIARRTALATGDDLATIIYTSGTTGRPKGVELTHGNFVSLVLGGIDALGQICSVPGARTLLFMPLAHVFARFISVLCVASGAVIGHAPDTRNLIADLAAFRPSFVLAVPRVFEKVYNSAEQKAGSGARLKLFRWAAKVAITSSRAIDAPGATSLVLRAQQAVAGVLVHRKLRAVLGGNLQYAISGGAPLGERLGHFYRGIGLLVLEGYGLTETTAPTTVNPISPLKVGTVGRPFAGTWVRTDDEDGQILVKGPHVFRGYHNNPEATAEAFVDGWFRTGDIGAFDDDGYLRITGRSKEIIVTAGGKNVAPAVLEDRLRGHPVVSQVVVVGDGRPFIGALVTLDQEMLSGWLSSHGLPQMDAAAAAVHAAVIAAVERAAERANEAVSRAESIRKVRILTIDFTEANGYLTPSLKVKRGAVLRDFAAEIDALYVDERTPAETEAKRSLTLKPGAR